jgi:hypothetical protein
MGFVIRRLNGTILYERKPGVSFSSTIVFAYLCPNKNCPSIDKTYYYLTMGDTYGDGWEGTVLSLKLNGTVLYTFTMGRGSISDTYPCSFTKYSLITV